MDGQGAQDRHEISLYREMFAPIFSFCYVCCVFLADEVRNLLGR